MEKIIQLLEQHPEKQKEILLMLENYVAAEERNRQIQAMRAWAQPFRIVRLSDLMRAGSWSPADLAADELKVPRLTWKERQKF